MTSSLAMPPVPKSGNDPSSSIDSASRAATQPPSRTKTRVCYYFQNKGKCRDGDNCRFIHERPSNPASQPDIPTSSTSNIKPDENGMIPDRKQAVTEPPSSRVVSKPVSQAQTQDPREFQLGQLRRRFSPKESRQAASEFLAVEEGTCLQFKLSPSDPDFPFEVAALECSLSVPLKYPVSRPTLRVQNQDIPRGFAVNVEDGFNNLAKEKQDATLLELMKLLDKNLEVFLSAQKAETVKIVVPTKDTRHLSTPATRISNAGPAGVGAEKSTSKNTANRVEASSITPKYQNPEFRYTPEQKLDASKRREVETRQLEARMGRLPLFKKSSDGISYTIPIEPRKLSELPVSLRAVKAIQLFVPLLYPLQGCRVQLEGVDALEAKPVQQGFEKKAASQKETTLMGHVNYLAQNMHILAKTEPETPKAPAQAVVAKPSPIPAAPESKGKEPEVHQDPERSHIQYITRPPEWTVVEYSDGELDSEDCYSYDSGDETYSDDERGAELKLKSAHGHDHGNEHESSQDPTSAAEHGTAISFPFIELYGIELLEVVTLNITVKCERCKDAMDITGLKNGIEKKENCKKCASPFLIGFRRNLVHSHAVRAGFLDLDGCIIGDMLPSTFIPTCSQCSTAYPLPGITTVRGEATSNVCRECHQKFTFKIPEVRFLRISSTHQLQATSGPRRKKDTLGLVPGTELPKCGRCRHYAKSYRWFRFSCCQKVYACDKCHDDSEEHPNEWANRMICGHCSREGNYRPEDCGFCHQLLIGKRGGGGFWEGGTGTRDPVKMSRKDPRKYRNRKAKK